MIHPSECKHEILMLGSHPSFYGKGWLCTVCGTFVNPGTNLRDDYVVVFAALKMERKNGLSEPSVDR